MKSLTILLVTLSLWCKAQTGNKTVLFPNNEGIQFLQGKSWEEVIKKAKEERKYIFVDCYTTWCLPCKKMDKEVYSLDHVGTFFNSKFIAYKLQMDSSKNDDELVKSAYPVAQYFRSAYKVNSFPTFLFFTPDGKILNKLSGALGPDDLIKQGEVALDPKKNYYALVDRYNLGERNLDEMSYLAQTALGTIKDTVFANKIAKEYLNQLKKDQWLTKENIEFMRMFTKTSKDVGFTIYFRYKDSINSIMEDDGYAQGLVSSIISKELVEPEVKKYKVAKATPDWEKLELNIQKKYGGYYGDRVVTIARLNWEGDNKNWTEWGKYYVKYVDKYVMSAKGSGHWFAFTLNNSAWAIFRYSNSKDELKAALAWSSRAVMMDPQANWMDTYANILYKLGNKEDAIKWQRIASKLDPGDRDIAANLNNMLNDKPTWPK